jgi:hypothetical protein
MSDLSYPSDAQGIFDETAKHLFTQGRRAVQFKYTDQGEAYESCAYRGATGAMCAVGRHIKDEEYAAWMEGLGCDVVLDGLEIYSCPQTLYARLSRHENLLLDFQCAHDSRENWISTLAMRDCLHRVAIDHGLNPSILETLSFADGR